MAEISGVQWCNRFPTSAAIEHLEPWFRDNVQKFLGALQDAAAIVRVSATRRPPERAYLMHYCCLIAGFRDGHGVFQQLPPSKVPAMAGVDIDWTHGGDLGAAIAAAVAMRARYGIVFPAALHSRHCEGLAIDMTIGWGGTLLIRDAQGTAHVINGPASGSNPALWQIGQSYGVIKLPSDPPHWSSDGH